MRMAAYIGGVLGLALLVRLVIRADVPAMVTMLGVAGWRLLWLIPYRALFYLLYAVGWRPVCARTIRPRRARLGYLYLGHAAYAMQSTACCR